ncbi:SDR family NAD(P)-dependent oxidoreductase [Oxalobacteraceae bacterium OTU3CAMAD1]|nr:SDR family NAD(P)-dependent oxidoreductase [Oxalobacteraceae bacterium OTU3CAMAD1]
MDSGVDIAIVGMAGRFPGAADVDALWRNVLAQVEAVTELDEALLRERGVDASALADPGYVRKAILFDGMERFDAGFFGYAPREAERIDPQHRQFLETAWQALEHAGYAGADGQAAARLTGVYAGSGPSLYMMRHLLPSLNLEDSDIASLLGVLNGSDPDALVSRVAYKLDLKGPAVAVQTACSTSLAAVHLACRGLLNYEADMALAGGVWLNLLQGRGYRHQPGAILSPDGHCRAFDAGAGGTAIGSGVGIVVLKRLADAIADRDTIHAVIRGSALNNDGADKVGYTAPSVAGQTAVIRAAHAMADVDAGSIGYVEAHGTGTTLGDPIEVAALTDAFRASTTRVGYCALGSVKTNVGHLDAAAGVTGLIKTVMALKHGVLPPSLNFTQPNPRIDFAASPFRVNTEARPWPAQATPRRAGVSSFGMGGTNVHLVLQEPPRILPVSAPTPAPAGDGGVALMLSARSAEALDAACRDLAAHLAGHPETALADVAHTLSVGRKHFGHRAVAMVRDHAEARRALAEKDPLLLLRGEVAVSPPPVAFMFPGQGSQHANMGRALYEAGGVFRETVDHCSMLLQADLELDLRTLLFPEPSAQADADRALARTALTQPALFVIEYALAQWWVAQGVRPDAMLGHSIGEYVAACLAGVFSLEDALRIVAARGRLLQATAPGAMLAVGLSEAALLAQPHAGCDVAAINAVDKCVLSGAVEAIALAERVLGQRGVAVQRLHVSHAFHSAQVEPMLAEFAALLSQVPLGEPRIPFVSNVSGRWITADEARSPAYWVGHVRGAVRFADGLEVLLTKAGRVLLEVGPGDTLAAFARRHPAAGGHAVLASQCHVRRAEHNAGQPARCLAQLWSLGAAVGESPMFHQSGARRVPLPTYPFERESYWLEPAATRVSGSQTTPTDSEPGIDRWFYTPVWRRVPLAARDHEGGTVLLIGDAGGATEQLCLALQTRGRRVLRVEQGTEFAQLEQHRFTVRAGERDDYARVLRRIDGEHGPLTDICHAWNLDVMSTPVDDARTPESGFFSLIALAQALGADDGNKVRITVVADGLEDVTGDEPLLAAKATLHGACKVIPQEYPHIDCRVIDFVRPAGTALPERIVAQIVAEIDAGDDAPVVAYRGAYRWTRTFERAPPAALGMRPAATQLRRHGVYMITGGLGGVGLALARYLAERWQARLVLIGRGMSPAHTATIAELEALGAQVWYRQVDVADRVRLRAAIDEATRRFGAINGVVHAAGVAGGGMIARLERSAVAKVLHPKLDGTSSLLAALAGTSPDFIMLCSSLTAITGGYGQADYCAANCYLDAVAAQAARVGGLPVVSVNWDTWRGVGMAAHHRLEPGSGIAAEQAGVLLERLSSLTQVPQVLVSTIAIEEQFAQARSTELADRLLPAAPVRRHSQPRPALRTPWIAADGELGQGLAGLWEEFLGIAAIGADDNLFELGGDSLLAIQLLAHVRQSYGVEIHPAAFFQTPTIRALALLVEERLIEELENAGSGDPAAQHIAAPA